MNRKFVFATRPFGYFFKKRWYSLHRWKNPYTYSPGIYVRIVDFGAITFGIKEPK